MPKIHFKKRAKSCTTSRKMKKNIENKFIKAQNENYLALGH